MTLNIPGYDNIVDTQVYTADLLIPARDGNMHRLKRVLMLGRYTEPSEGDVCAKIQETAKKNGNALALPAGYLPNGSDDLEVRIKALPEQLRRALIDGHEGVYDVVRKSTPAQNIPPEKEPFGYVTVGYGILPMQVIETRDVSKGIVDWYEEMLVSDEVKQMGIGKCWDVEIRVKDGALIDREHLRVLQEYGAASRAGFRFNGGYNPVEIAPIMDAIYAGLKTPEDIASLKDSSGEELILASIPAINGVVQWVMMNEAIRAQQEVRGPGNNNRGLL